MHEMPVPAEADPRRETLLLALAALFIGFFVAADLIGAKGFHFTIFGLKPRHLGLSDGDGDFVATVGILAFPLTFILTDIINEYFGRRIVRSLTVLAIGVNLLLQPVVQSAVSASPVSFIPGVSADQLQQSYQWVLGPSWAIVIGSMTAFLIGQFLDIAVFTWLRHRTGGKLLWLRAQGSTLVSQLIDSFVVIFVAFVFVPMLTDSASGRMGWGLATNVALTNYVVKFVVAIAITPLLYLVHFAVDAWVGKETAERMILDAHPVDPK
jgi:queuosine precursor transporter